MANLKKGDRVVTTGGIWGAVVEIGDETVTLKVDATTRITFTKEAIAHYLPIVSPNYLTSPLCPPYLPSYPPYLLPPQNVS